MRTLVKYTFSEENLSLTFEEETTNSCVYKTVSFLGCRSQVPVKYLESIIRSEVKGSHIFSIDKHQLTIDFDEGIEVLHPEIEEECLHQEVIEYHTLEEKTSELTASDWQKKYFYQKRSFQKEWAAYRESIQQRQIKNAGEFYHLHEREIKELYQSYDDSLRTSLHRLKKMDVFRFLRHRNSIVDEIIEKNRVSRISFQLLKKIERLYREINLPVKQALHKDL